MKKAIIFIDGSNFYHNSKKTGADPKEIGFEKLCILICKKLNYEWKKTYYYNAIPDIKDNTKVYHKHMKFLNDLNKHPKIEVRTRKLQKHSTKEVQEEKRIIIKNSSICAKCKKEAVKNCLECIGDYNKKEKGIDVMIAVDMIDKTLKKEGEACILVSGDADFIPSLNLIKENGGEAVVCAPKIGLASEIREKHRHSYLKRNDLEECYNNGI